MFTKLIDSKKMINKLKQCCTLISKYNLTSPVLLQFYIENNSLEILLTHSVTNHRFDDFQLFKTITYDNFEITEQEVKDKLFDCNDNLMISIPVIVSSTKIDSNEIQEYVKQSNDLKYSLESFYIYPKFILYAIKNDIIKDFEIQYKDEEYFNIFINYDESNPAFKYKLFIDNNEKLQEIYHSGCAPLYNPHYNNDIRNVFSGFYKDGIQTFFHIEGKDEIKQFLEKHVMSDFINIIDKNENSIQLYHNVFVKINVSIEELYVIKRYFDPNRNIVALHIRIRTTNKQYVYFKYNYYE